MKFHNEKLIVVHAEWVQKGCKNGSTHSAVVWAYVSAGLVTDHFMSYLVVVHSAYVPRYKLGYSYPKTVLKYNRTCYM